MMRRLFWRIFAAFWAATVIVLVSFAWIATSNFETEKIPGLGVTRLQAAMDDLLTRTSRELRHDGIEPHQGLAAQRGGLRLDRHLRVRARWKGDARPRDD